MRILLLVILFSSWSALAEQNVVGRGLGYAEVVDGCITNVERYRRAVDDAKYAAIEDAKGKCTQDVVVQKSDWAISKEDCIPLERLTYSATAEFGCIIPL